MKCIAMDLKNKVDILLKNGFFYILIGNTLTKMIAFVSSIVIVRLIDKSSYASLAYADNIYSYIILFSGLGMAQGILKFCVSDEKKRNKAFFEYALKCGTLFQCILSILILIVIDFVNIPFANAKILIKLLFLYPILCYILNVFQNYARARLNNRLYAETGVIQTILTLILSVMLVYLLGIKGVVWGRYIALLVTIFFCFNFLKKENRNIEKYNLNKNEKKKFFILSISMMIANLFSTIIPINESFIVNNVIQNEVISANYKVANLIPSQLVFITNSIIIYIFPIIAKKNNLKEVWMFSKKSAIYTGIGILIICIIGILLTPLIVYIIYGNQYQDIDGLSILLWGVYFFNAGFRMIPMNVLPAMGVVKFNSILSVITCVIHFILDYILIYTFGISGAVFTTALVYIVTGVLYWYYLYKKCNG